MPSDESTNKERKDGLSLSFQAASSSIELLRFPLIVLIVFIHARFQGPDYPDPGTERLCNSISFGKMPHCAVVAFLVISGYLFASRAEQIIGLSGYLGMLRRKFKSLVIPYFLWNSLIMLPHLFLSFRNISSPLLPAPKFAGMNLLQIFVRSYGLDMREMPIDVPLWYVRDLMLLFVISPALLFLIRHLPKYVSLPLLISGTVLLADKTICFFSFGMFCGYFDVDFRPLKKIWFPCLVLLPAYCILADCFPAILHKTATEINWGILNWLSLLFFAAFSVPLKHLPGNIRKWLVLAGGYSFWIYCSHSVFATTSARIGLRLHCLGMPPLLWMILGTFGTIAITVAAFFVMRRIAPGAARLLCGGRFPKQPAAKMQECLKK